MPRLPPWREPPGLPRRGSYRRMFSSPWCKSSYAKKGDSQPIPPGNRVPCPRRRPDESGRGKPGGSRHVKRRASPALPKKFHALAGFGLEVVEYYSD